MLKGWYTMSAAQKMTDDGISVEYSGNMHNYIYLSASPDEKINTVMTSFIFNHDRCQR